MKVKQVILCQHAVGYENGSFSILNGGLSSASVPSFPATLPLTVLVHALADPSEPPVHHFAISVRDAEGRILEIPGPEGRLQPMRLEANLTVQAGPNHPPEVPLPVNFIPSLPVFIQKPGRFEVRCEVDGEVHSESLFVQGPRSA